MKILKSTTMIFAILIVIATLFGFEKGFPLLLLCGGFREIISTKEYHDKNQNKWAVASLIVGICVCICGFLALTKEPLNK